MAGQGLPDGAVLWSSCLDVSKARDAKAVEHHPNAKTEYISSAYVDRCFRALATKAESKILYITAIVHLFECIMPLWVEDLKPSAMRA